MRTSPTPDVLVVGAGVLGAAVAYEAAKRGLHTVVIDSHAVGDGATRWSMAGLSWLTHLGGPCEGLARAGLMRHQTLSQELANDTGYRPISLLALARTNVELDRLKGRMILSRAAGFE